MTEQQNRPTSPIEAVCGASGDTPLTVTCEDTPWMLPMDTTPISDPAVPPPTDTVTRKEIRDAVIAMQKDCEESAQVLVDSINDVTDDLCDIIDRADAIMWLLKNIDAQYSGLDSVPLIMLRPLLTGIKCINGSTQDMAEALREYMGFSLIKYNRDQSGRSAARFMPV